MKISKNSICPCQELERVKKRYKKCCKVYHDGKSPENALILMKSRYSAYAIGLSKYIIETTIPTYKEFQNPNWKTEIEEFSFNSKFLGLKILNKKLNKTESYVTFRVNLINNGKDNSFTEKSKFIKIENRWFYDPTNIEIK